MIWTWLVHKRDLNKSRSLSGFTGSITWPTKSVTRRIFKLAVYFFLNSNFIESARDLEEMFLNDKFHFNNIQNEYTFNWMKFRNTFICLSSVFSMISFKFFFYVNKVVPNLASMEVIVTLHALSIAKIMTVTYKTGRAMNVIQDIKRQPAK